MFIPILQVKKLRHSELKTYPLQYRPRQINLVGVAGFPQTGRCGSTAWLRAKPSKAA